MKLPLLIAGLLLAASGLTAQNAPPAGSAASANATLPQDKHEGITVLVDAYTRVARGKDKFGKANPLAVGIFPVEVFLKNETNLPVKLGMDTIQLEVRTAGGSHQDLDWLDPVQVAAAVAHPGGPSQPKMRRFPVGLGVPKDDKRDKMLEILKPYALDTDIIAPNSTVHGFLFFDVAGNIPAPGDSSLYLPDLTVATSKQTLMFFEVTLGTPTAAAQ
jgi:hypothetical protein